MKVMVFDVSAEIGGALSILNSFYNEYKTDQNDEHIFIVSKPELKETENIKVLQFPWVKKSWLHRIYFDYFIAPKLVKKYKVDEVLSLQNIIVPNVKKKQKVFVHNALPFSEHRFSFFDSKLLWFYQNILGKRIFKSIKKADSVMVQTNWMKEKCIEKLNIEPNKVEVVSLKLDIEVKRPFTRTKESLSTFFYPANGVAFKNHKVIIDACLKLKDQGIKDYKVIFTLKGNENNYILDLYKKVRDYQLPIEFIGNLSRDDLFDYYSRSILIFPSYIETVGLPLIEAGMHGTPILVSDSPYSHEILKGVENVSFFNAHDIRKLAALMKEHLAIKLPIGSN